MTVTVFGTAPDGRAVHRIELAQGALRVALLDWGAILQDVRLEGIDWPLTAGSAEFRAYLGPLRWFGAIVGPVANRLAGAEALIGGRPFRFAANEGATLLHGGAAGTHARLWDIAETGPAHARLRLRLPDLCDGFPGTREIEALFRLEPPATLTLALSARSDAPTLMNLANHSYWTLDGGGGIGGQRLRVAAAHWLPTDAGLPTGEIRAVSGRHDLRADRMLAATEAIDHNFCLAEAPRALTEAARLTGRQGLRLTLLTTAPGLQVYTGAHLDSEGFAGHHGLPYGPHDALALEPQLWPDAPRHAGFPSIRLGPGETFRQETRFAFSR